MNTIGTITMSMRELDRLKAIQAVADARLKPERAAERLNLSVRQVERLVWRYHAAGVAGLVSGKRGRPSNHQLPNGVAQRALALIRERYEDFGPSWPRSKRPSTRTRPHSSRTTSRCSTRCFSIRRIRCATAPRKTSTVTRRSARSGLHDRARHWRAR
jgi:hypothetical protein